MALYDPLLNWFNGAKEWLEWLWLECWRQLSKFLQTFVGWGLIAIGWIYTIAKWIGDSVAEMAAAIDAFKFPDISHGSGPMSQALAFINTILPLQEMLGFAVAYVALRVCLTIYKLIKSWIPTLA